MVHGGSIWLYSYPTLHASTLQRNVTSYGVEASESAYSISQILVGAHFTKTEEIRFKRVIIGFSHLNEWVGVSGIEIEPPRDVNGEWKIKYRRPPDFHGPTVGDNTVSITFGSRLPTRRAVQSEARVEQRAYFMVASTDRKQLNECWKLVRSVQDLLTIAVGSAVHILSLEGDIELETAESPPLRVKLYSAQPGFPKTIESIHPAFMTFTLSTVKKYCDFTNMMKQWLEKNEKLEPVRGLYSMTLWERSTYLENDFLNLVQAIESYHRRFATNYEMNPEAHEKRLEEILGTVKEDYRDWLRNELQFSNEPSLPKRLREIVGRYNETIKKTVADEGDFLDTIVLTRHYHTHYDERLKNKAASGQKLFKLTHILKLLLEMCLVEEMGFNREQIRLMFQRKAEGVASIPWTN